jgi:hypothetical protein
MRYRTGQRFHKWANFRQRIPLLCTFARKYASSSLIAKLLHTCPCGLSYSPQAGALRWPFLFHRQLFFFFNLKKKKNSYLNPPKFLFFLKTKWCRPNYSQLYQISECVHVHGQRLSFWKNIWEGSRWKQWNPNGLVSDLSWEVINITCSDQRSKDGNCSEKQKTLVWDFYD